MSGRPATLQTRNQPSSTAIGRDQGQLPVDHPHRPVRRRGRHCPSFRSPWRPTPGRRARAANSGSRVCRDAVDEAPDGRADEPIERVPALAESGADRQACRLVPRGRWAGEQEHAASAGPSTGSPARAGCATARVERREGGQHAVRLARSTGASHRSSVPVRSGMSSATSSPSRATREVRQPDGRRA